MIGCEKTIPDSRDGDGLVNCPHCGVCFDPTAEAEPS